MPRFNTLKSEAAWRELITTDKDWKAADTNMLRSLLVSMHLIRAFEEKVLELAGQGLVHGPAHSAIGQEGGAVGSVLPMRASDQVNGSHRAHHQFLAKTLHYVSPEGLDLAAPINEKTQWLLQKTLAEILGLDQGFCRGRGGSMHLRWAKAGVLGDQVVLGVAATFAVVDIVDLAHLPVVQVAQVHPAAHVEGDAGLLLDQNAIGAVLKCSGEHGVDYQTASAGEPQGQEFAQPLGVQKRPAR